MSKLETNTIDTVSGTSTLQVGSTNTSTINLGVSGDTINVPSGVTIANSGTATGFGGTNTPAFEAYRTSNQSLAGNNTFTKVQFNVERFDTAGNYDNSTNYRFTPTTAGKYFVYAHVKIEASGTNANGYTETAIYFNGSIIGTTMIDVRDSSSNGGKTFTVPVSTTINFNGSSDYVEIYARCFDNTGATATIIADSTYVINQVFGAYKLIGV